MSTDVKVLSNEFLKEIQTDALVFRGNVEDFDQFAPGIWIVYSSTKNRPAGTSDNGVLENILCGIAKIQRYTERPQTRLPRIIMRICWSSVWSQWLEIQLTPLST